MYGLALTAGKMREGTGREGMGDGIDQKGRGRQ